MSRKQLQPEVLAAAVSRGYFTLEDIATEIDCLIERHGCNARITGELTVHTTKPFRRKGDPIGKPWGKTEMYIWHYRPRKK